MLSAGEPVPDEAIVFHKLMVVARKAVASLTGAEVNTVEPDDDGEFCCTSGSAGVFTSVRTDPPALIFRAFLLDEVQESPTLYALLNEINKDLDIGQVYYNEDVRGIRYYYKHFAENPSPELVAHIIDMMTEIADLHDDRLKNRLGGKRFREPAGDEVDV